MGGKFNKLLTASLLLLTCVSARAQEAAVDPESWDLGKHMAGFSFSATTSLVNFPAGSEFETGRNDANTNDMIFSHWFVNGTNDFSGVIGGNDTLRYLDIECCVTNPIYRTIFNSCGTESADTLFTTNIAAGLFIDAQMRFDAYRLSSVHPAPDGDTGEKLVLWLAEVANSDTNSPNAFVTNLMATAGFYSQKTLIATNYILCVTGGTSTIKSPAELGTGLHRVTIKAINNITKNSTESYVGFVVYVDGVLATYGSDTNNCYARECMTDDAVIADLNATAQPYYTRGSLTNSLLPSLVHRQTEGDQAMSAAGFAGTGYLKEVYFDTYGVSNTVPGFAEDVIKFDVTLEEGIESFRYDGVIYSNNWYCVTNVEDLGSDNFQTNFAWYTGTANFVFEAGGSSAITIDNVKYANCASGTYIGKANSWYDGNHALLTNDTTSCSIYFADYGGQSPSIVLTAFLGKYVVADQSYRTLFGDYSEPIGAFYAAIATEGEAALKIEKDTVIEDSKSADGNSFHIGSGQILYLDLAGHTLMGNYPTWATIENEGYLVITNSTPEVGQVLDACSGNGIGALAYRHNSITHIYGGKFERIVSGLGDIWETASMEIFNGEFLDVTYCPFDPEDPVTGFYLKDFLAPGKAAKCLSLKESDPSKGQTGRSYFKIVDGANVKFELNPGVESCVITQYNGSVTNVATGEVGLDLPVFGKNNSFNVVSGEYFTVYYVAAPGYAWNTDFDNPVMVTNVLITPESDMYVTAPTPNLPAKRYLTLPLTEGVTVVVTQNNAAVTGSGLPLVFEIKPAVDFSVTWTAPEHWYMENSKPSLENTYNSAVDLTIACPEIRPIYYDITIDADGDVSVTKDSQNVIGSTLSATNGAVLTFVLANTESYLMPVYTYYDRHAGVTNLVAGDVLEYRVDETTTNTFYVAPYSTSMVTASDTNEVAAIIVASASKSMQSAVSNKIHQITCGTTAITSIQLADWLTYTAKNVVTDDIADEDYVRASVELGTRTFIDGDHVPSPDQDSFEHDSVNHQVRFKVLFKWGDGDDDFDVLKSVAASVWERYAKIGITSDVTQANYITGASVAADGLITAAWDDDQQTVLYLYIVIPDDDGEGVTQSGTSGGGAVP